MFQASLLWLAPLSPRRVQTPAPWSSSALPPARTLPTVRPALLGISSRPLDSESTPRNHRRSGLASPFLCSSSGRPSRTTGPGHSAGTHSPVPERCCRLAALPRRWLLSVPAPSPPTLGIASPAAALAGLLSDARASSSSSRASHCRISL